ncbi:DUF2326 domain-containing protein [Leptospira alstonii]|uniref:DUF2326 domain-containing protein n=1 Tax=Leptospira alstonii TaxID=28452 RepID=UPI00077411D0|nr:DUF2326 domain-containing protein [Leptospira alstonii]
MFLKNLIIKKNDVILRDITFRKGLNLIIDETKKANLKESGNNVGKTTVLRLIDYCFGSSGENIYRDPEFREKSNTQIEAFLKNNNITISMTLKEDLDKPRSREVTVVRNFLKYKEKIQLINGESYINKNEFDLKLKELIFKTSVLKPTTRQIISKNIRHEKNSLINTIKVLHPNTTLEEYEALYLFWLGIDTDSSARKQQLYEAKKTEEKVVQNLKKESSQSEIEQALVVINRDIADLDRQKAQFNINQNYEKDIDLLNNTKARINQITTEYGRLSIRRELIYESKDDLEKEFVQIDTSQLAELYRIAGSFIPKLHAKFEDLVLFHNNMLKEKINYVSNELPDIESKIFNLRDELTKLNNLEKDLSQNLARAGAIKELEEIINRLNSKYEQKGKYEEQLRQWSASLLNLKNIETELENINNSIDSLDTVLDEKIEVFNKYFSKMSERLYDEQFILSYDKLERAYELKISNIAGNLGTGKKKGQIAAFDFAYIQFCEEMNIPCLHFVLHDQIENIHGNQIQTLSDVANETNSQFILPILKDKLPKGIDTELFKILSLSQKDKLFKIN